MSDEPEGAFDPARFARFAEYDPDEVDGDTLTWYVRGRHLLVAYTEADTGAVLACADQPDEYVVLLPDPGGTAQVRAAGRTTEVPGRSLAVVPPGPSEIRLDARLAVVRLFTTRGPDEPAGAGEIRCFGLDAPPEERSWRTATLLVTYPEPVRGSADPACLESPSDPDSEQCSITLHGEFVHHVRWPWTANLADWREDEHERCGTPSAAIIPAGTIHATQAVGPGRNERVDVYCPPPS